MAIQVNQNYVHWNYFVALEQDLAELSRYVEFSNDNFKTYSIELAHLLLAAASEVDVVLKLICSLKNPAKNHENINDYKNSIKQHLPYLLDRNCYIHRFGLTFEPWIDWNGDKNPIWWRSYNNVKHERNIHFKDANLENTLNAMAGLSLAIVYYYQEIFNQENAHTFQCAIDRLKPKLILFEF